MDENEQERDVRLRRQMTLEAFTSEMQALQRMNPKVPIACIEVSVRTGDRTYKYAIAEFLGYLCIDAFHTDYGDWGRVDRVEVRVI